ncbi:phosphoribosyl-AMP cyclohydrolase [Amphritea japonica]|uniref:Phosphoribosyl-AMP cyclohydrolase n=1 Tax=Amphritea japonica ATCC BAA-1530 TaxID=1278309 RepID=A0A7R6PCQ9_9GAMM|nr:phosphoribosyl-AMP cyclohydrolase [Amphritea japonica]BBB27008.1 phosphoribosyl-AMP cyclohydrolase [Amphritea japonica ATCC BAA-1530]
MAKAFFQSIENSAHNDRLPLAEVVENLSFNEQGLIPVIAQDVSSKAVLMQAWMNSTALDRTLATGRMVYWSRSRNCFWEKGATSGHTQTLVSMSFDCDGDVILCQVNQQGAACHTGRPSCFYLAVKPEQGEVVVIGEAS